MLIEIKKALMERLKMLMKLTINIGSVVTSKTDSSVSARAVK